LISVIIEVATGVGYTLRSVYPASNVTNNLRIGLPVAHLLGDYSTTSDRPAAANEHGAMVVVEFLFYTMEG
jgi:hypothetical protein